MNTLLKQSNYFHITLALLFTFLLFPSFFISRVEPIALENYLWDSLSPSWRLALSFCKNKDLIWGKDVTFTYGPLSYLAIKNGWESNKWIMLAFDIFYALNFFALFYQGIKKSENKIGALFICLVLAAIVPGYSYGGVALVLLIFLSFWIVRNLEKPSTVNYVFQIILLSVLFFIKFNTGLVSFLIYYASITYLLVSKKESLTKAICYGLLPILFLILLSFPLHVTIPDYAKFGFSIVSGYNDIMFIDPPQIPYTLNLAIAFMVISISILLFKFFRLEKKYWLIKILEGSIFFICLFILFKQSFVRADYQHILDFFRYSLLLIFALPDFTQSKFRSIQNAMLFSLIGIILFVGLQEKEITLERTLKKLDKSEYMYQVINFEEESKLKLEPNQNKLPEHLLKKIGQQTIDIFPWSIQLLLENNLNYLPRPVLQSYSCYNSNLQNQNFNHYNSSKAPQYVLLDLETIDRRNVFLDEVKTNIVFTRNYHVCDSFTHHTRKLLLLEKNEKTIPLSFEKVKTYTLDINETFKINKESFYEIELTNSIRGKVKTILRHGPEIYLKLFTKTDTIYNRTSVPMLKKGLYLPYYIETVNDFYHLMNRDAVPPKNEIIACQLNPWNQSNFNSQIKISEFKISQ